jgi:hypothetical protein
LWDHGRCAELCHIILGMAANIGLPETVLADTGFRQPVGWDGLASTQYRTAGGIGRTQPYRPCDFRPPPKPKAGRQNDRTLLGEGRGPSREPKQAACAI